MMKNLLLILFAASASAHAALTPIQLRCEGRENPLGVDAAAPQLGWLLQAGDNSLRGLHQTAYQVLAASAADLLVKDQGDLWDSGKIASDAMNHITYAGKPLTTSATVFWKVRVWDQSGASSLWSLTSRWTMGVIKSEDWHASWITAPGSGAVVSSDALGYHAEIAKQAGETKWVQVDLGHAPQAKVVRLVPVVHDGTNGFGFPVRFKVETSDSADFGTATMIADHTAADFPNPGAKPLDLTANVPLGRYVRVTATKIWGRANGDFCFALRQIGVLAGNINLAAKATVSSLDSVEGYGWARVAVTDGVLGSAFDANVLKFVNPLFRREFPVKPGLVRALVHVSGLGQYEMFINGAKVGDQLLAPGWTNYKKTCLYDSYDITNMLKLGANATGISLGNGMYNIVGGRYTKFKGSFGPLKAIAQLRLEYTDGSLETIGTDASWQVAPGPITFSCVYGGEDYDARVEKSGWNLPKLANPATSGWTPAELTEGPGGELVGLSAAAAPIKAIETLKPVATRNLSEGVMVYDLGQNASIMPRIAVSGPAGSSVWIIPSELARENGDIDDTMCGGKNWWEYTLKGQGNETWFPQFYYRGARYLKVELRPAPGDSGLPKVSAIVGVVVHTSAAPVGEFSCSNDLFARTFTLVRWAQRSNLVSIITDCPTREKLGWLEQYHLNGPSLRYNYDLAALYTKGMRDMHDSQEGSGMVPTTAPEYPRFGGSFRDSPEWGATFILSAWQQYEFHGDVEMLRRYYPDQQRYATYLAGRAQNQIIDYGLGDWYDIGPKSPGESQLTPRALTGTAIYFEEIRAMARIAAALGKTADAERYAAQAAEIRAAFNQKFFNAETKQYATGSQCSNAMPLVLDLVNQENRPAVLDNLVKDVEAKGLTAGDVGYRYLLCALAGGGRSDVIFMMNNQADKPGYGYQLAHGATSLTEAWNGLRGSSQNHFMLGQINEWFYHDLAGIQCDPDGPGFRQIIIKPNIVGDFNLVKASYHSGCGMIGSQWKRSGNALTLDITIPTNTSATIYVPATDAASVRESGGSAASAAGLKYLRMENGAAVFAAGSGSYRFSSTAPVAEVH